MKPPAAPTRSVRATVLACLMPVLAPQAQAARPLTTDDADVLEPRACEWESLASRLRVPRVGSGTAWQTQLGCGVIDRMQLSASIASSPGDDKRTQTAGFGGKVQLLGGEGKDRLRLAATLAVNMLRVDDSVFEVQDNSVNLAASQTWAGAWTGHLNMGWTHNRPSGQSGTTWNLALERDLGRGIDGVGEIYGDDHTRPWVSTGVRWALSDNASLCASLSVRTGSVPTRLATAGFRLAF